MKAAVYYETGAPEVLRYEDVARPDDATRATCWSGSRRSASRAATRSTARAASWRPTPTSSATSAPAPIEAVGDAVTDRAEGQQVVCTMAHGSHAELVVGAGQP